MSFQAMTWATQQDLPAMQKIVLLMMANRTNHETGLCFPSHDLLAKECGMSKRSLIDQLSKLEGTGLIEVIRSTNDKGMKNVNRYKLNMKTLEVNEIGSAGDALHSARHSLGSAGDALGGSAGDAHKPVTKEPIKEHVITRQRKSNPKIAIPKDWTPSDRCYELVIKAGITKEFADRLLGEFVMYWLDRGDARSTWDTTFLNHVKTQSERSSLVSYKPANQPAQSVRKLRAI